LMREASRDQVLLIAIALLVFGGLLASNFRGISSWHARRAIGSMAGAEPLLRRIWPWKSLLGEGLEDRVALQVVVIRIVGLMFAGCGLVFLLSYFGVLGPVYSNS
jgi:hypothetical protein